MAPRTTRLFFPLGTGRLTAVPRHHRSGFVPVDCMLPICSTNAAELGRSFFQKIRSSFRRERVKRRSPLTPARCDEGKRVVTLLWTQFYQSEREKSHTNQSGGAVAGSDAQGESVGGTIVTKVTPTDGGEAVFAGGDNTRATREVQAGKPDSGVHTGALASDTEWARGEDGEWMHVAACGRESTSWWRG